MAGIGVLDLARRRVEQHEKERDEAVGPRAPRDGLREPPGHLGHADALVRPGVKRRLERRHQQRRADALAAHVGDGGVDLAVRSGAVVEVVAGDLPGSDVRAVELVARDVRRVLGQKTLLDLASQRELAVHLPLLGVLGHQARVLDLGRGHVGERRQEAKVRLLEGAMAHPAIHVDQPDHLALVFERRRQHGLDAGEADRVGQRDLRSAGGVHEQQAIALLDDRRDERSREPQLVGRDSVGHPDDGGDELAGGGRAQENDAPVGTERLENLVHQELEELVDRDVLQELDRELVDDAQRLDQLAELLGRKLGIGLRVLAQQLGRRLQDRVVEGVVPGCLLDTDTRGGLGLHLDRDGADRDPIARAQRLNGDQPLAVQERPVARAEVLDGQGAVGVLDDAGVLAREHLVGNGQIVDRRAPDRHDRAVEDELLGRHTRPGQVEVEHVGNRKGF